MCLLVPFNVKPVTLLQSEGFAERASGTYKYENCNERNMQLTFSVYTFHSD